MSSGSSFDQARVLWKATAAEDFFAISHDNKANLTCYRLTFVARAPLQYQQVFSALQHLYRKLPNLRACMPRDEEGQLWMCRMEKETIHLQFLDKCSNSEEIFVGETRKQYDTERGPLWRVTVIPCSEVLDEAAAEEGYHNQYHILFGLQHAMTDGHSSVRMCGHFLRLLNDVIDGNAIDDETQLAEFVDDRYSRQLMNEAKQLLKSDSHLHDYYTDLVNKQNMIDQLLIKAYPPLTNGDYTSLTISTEMNKLQTSKFLTKTKSQKVTVHSAFSSVIHQVIIEMLLEAGYSQEVFSLFSHHDLNERRYWNIDAEKAFGVHVGSHRFLVTIPKNIAQDFWSNTQTFHSQFNTEITNKQPLFVDAIKQEMNPSVKTSDNYYDDKSPTNSYYAISNMGDITRFFKNIDGSDCASVRAVGIQRFTAVHSYETYNTFCLQTMNGKFLFSLDYNTRYISTETAKTMLKKASSIFQRVSC